MDLLLAFSDEGQRIIERIETFLPEAILKPREMAGSEFLEKHIDKAERIVFVGSTGIAIRLMLDYIKSKTKDPAVVVIDTKARFGISLLSGHLGGANDFTNFLAEKLQATSVITTATDLKGLVAVDVWSRRMGYELLYPERIVNVSSKALRGETIRVKSEVEVELPEGYAFCSENEDVLISPYVRETKGVQLVPKLFHLGMGARKGAPTSEVLRGTRELLKEQGIREESIKAVHSIDIKKEEECLKEVASYFKVPFLTHTKEELNRLKGDFSSSELVLRVTGVDCVSERSALIDSDELVVKKIKGEGFTLAIGRERK
ncbi:cobalt-precorrin 5A hydrolase [Guggenheimella bovis]